MHVSYGYIPLEPHCNDTPDSIVQTDGDGDADNTVSSSTDENYKSDFDNTALRQELDEWLAVMGFSIVGTLGSDVGDERIMKNSPNGGHSSPSLDELAQLYMDYTDGTEPGDPKVFQNAYMQACLSLPLTYPLTKQAKEFAERFIFKFNGQNVGATSLVHGDENLPQSHIFGPLCQNWQHTPTEHECLKMTVEEYYEFDDDVFWVQSEENMNDYFTDYDFESTRPGELLDTEDQVLWHEAYCLHLADKKRVFDMDTVGKEYGFRFPPSYCYEPVPLAMENKTCLELLEMDRDHLLKHGFHTERIPKYVHEALCRLKPFPQHEEYFPATEQTSTAKGNNEDVFHDTQEHQPWESVRGKRAANYDHYSAKNQTTNTTTELPATLRLRNNTSKSSLTTTSFTPSYDAIKPNVTTVTSNASMMTPNIISVTSNASVITPNVTSVTSNASGIASNLSSISANATGFLPKQPKIYYHEADYHHVDTSSSTSSSAAVLAFQCVFSLLPTVMNEKSKLSGNYAGKLEKVKALLTVGSAFALAASPLIILVGGTAVASSAVSAVGSGLLAVQTPFIFKDLMIASNQKKSFQDSEDPTVKYVGQNASIDTSAAIFAKTAKGMIQVMWTVVHLLDASYQTHILSMPARIALMLPTIFGIAVTDHYPFQGAGLNDDVLKLAMKQDFPLVFILHKYASLCDISAGSAISEILGMTETRWFNHIGANKTSDAAELACWSRFFSACNKDICEEGFTSKDIKAAKKCIKAIYLYQKPAYDEVQCTEYYVENEGLRAMVQGVQRLRNEDKSYVCNQKGWFGSSNVYNRAISAVIRTLAQRANPDSPAQEGVPLMNMSRQEAGAGEHDMGQDERIPYDAIRV